MKIKMQHFVRFKKDRSKQTLKLRLLNKQPLRFFVETLMSFHFGIFGNIYLQKTYNI